jgi:hypothetical protein
MSSQFINFLKDEILGNKKKVHKVEDNERDLKVIRKKI